MNFGIALECLKNGRLVRRKGWNGKGMFLYYVAGSRFTVSRAPLMGIFPDGTEIDYQPHIDIRTADGKCAVWTASQTDLLAEDWEIA